MRQVGHLKELRILILSSHLCLDISNVFFNKDFTKKTAYELKNMIKLNKL
jgi:hypothetical protein